MLWSTAIFPTLARLDCLAEDQLFAGLSEARRRELLHDESEQTAVERGDGHIPAIRFKQPRGRLGSVEQLAAAYKESVGPSQLEASTRRAYQAAWRLVVTWGIAHECVELLMPMTKQTLEALTQELLMVGCAAGTIRNTWSSIEDRHRRFGLELPLGGFGDFRRMSKAVAAVRGTPSRIIFPIGSHHLQRMLELVGLTAGQEQEILMCCTGTALNCRVGEITFLQICDLLWDLDAAFSVEYMGTTAIRIYRRKQDTGRKGHYPRIGCASRAEWDIVSRLKRHAERQGLAVSPECEKEDKPGARCRHCPPLFFIERRRAKGGPLVQEMVSRQMVTNAVKKSLELIGVDSRLYSGISMRRGGISAALTAKVPAPVLYLQSGHGSKNAAQSYMVPRDPGVWYENFAALHL